MKRTDRALEEALRQVDATGLRRSRTTVSEFAAGRTHPVTDGRALVDFSSNDYLGLTQHPALVQALTHAAAHTGVGSGASHFITGHGVEHARLEEEIAAFTGRERALLFSTGYMANLAVLTALAGPGERILLDRLSHASLIDGARLSGAAWRRYAHADATAVARDLQRDTSRSTLTPTTVIATDGVFSMDGDLAPLPELARLADASGAWLVVDDAHGLGVVGASGRGTLEHHGLDAVAVPVLVGTFGKAFGCFGAFVAGSDRLIEFLLQKARTAIYTTAVPQAIAAATRVALQLIRQDSGRRERVLALTARFRERALAAQLPLAPSNTPIQPVILGSAAAALAAQRELLAQRQWVVAIRPPTVPEGSARLRVSLSAAHTEEEVDVLVGHLARACGAGRTERVSPPHWGGSDTAADDRRVGTAGDRRRKVAP